MSRFRFIHCSDLHIDSPFKNLDGVDAAMRDRLRAATQQAFANIVTLALKEKVDAVIIAGDVFDGEDKSLQAQFRFKRELERLTGAGIPAFIAHGNHDPLSSWSETLNWPAGVHVFPGNAVASIPVEREGQVVATIYGISYAKKEVLDNLVPLFSKIDPAVPAVGVLHTNVGGDKNHDNYAPCKLEDLRGVAVDYWALGHIHAPQVLRDAHPAVVYSGNPQARHFKEGGEKGCYLVTLAKGQAPDIVFHAVDTVRYVRTVLDVTGCDTWNAVAAAIQDACRKQLAAIGERDLVVEWTLTGRTLRHGDLQDTKQLAELRDEVLTEFEGGAQSVWMELESNTSGYYDLDALRQGKDFIADVIAHYDGVLDADDPGEWQKVLEPVFGERGGRLPPPDADTLKAWIAQARDVTLDHLMPDED
ncbi:metallophosphoesterase family protein [Nitrospina watsonii]|uniref:DNA repair exonuclease family protein YhaO n=1 Tax=Nitrospina watsonii TaxID=1323948 RepID=A0ABM9HB89_9BACT|nr:DNA repair exonuclease [Nitrospina watsonii]CAI2717383.1 DNA repair exonuclease family protein YhaO [Nitrospina watsonii]